MSRFREDPLLGLARIILTIALGIIGFVFIGLVIALPAMLVFKGAVIAEIVSEGGPAELYWGIFGLFAGAAVALGLTFFFIRHLRRIVMTVSDGDPFVPVNATRLVSMAWLALGVWVVGIPIRAIATWVEVIGEGSGVNVSVGEDGSMSLALVLTLFVLARVFRMGSRMREDLEGTV